MKNIIKSMFALALGAMAFTACSDNDDNINGQSAQLTPMTFTASMEGQGSTRTGIDYTEIWWMESDKLSIFDGAGNREFLLQGGVGTTSATFVGEAAKADNYYALYPYTKDASLSSGKITGAVLPAKQTVFDEQYVDPTATLMMAKTDDAQMLEFKNVCAYIKVTPKFACSAITFTSKGTESLAGTVTLDYNDGEPTATVTSGGTNEVTLTGNIVAYMDYYIAVLPATLEDEFAITFTTEIGDYQLTSPKTLELTRNNVTNFGEINFEDLRPTQKGSADATIGEGTQKVKWVQLWEGGPKFAEYNVGVTDGKAESFGGYYAWGGSQDKVDDHDTGTTDLKGNKDTATKLWGTNWRMPTKAELEALISSDNCIVERIENYNGTNINGLLCKGKTGTAYENNSIFLPEAGFFNVSYVTPNGLCYWSSTPLDSDKAYELYDVSGNPELLNDDKYYGCSVRAVLNEIPTTGTAEATIGGVATDVNWVQLWKDGPKFAEYNVGVTDSKAESYGGYYKWSDDIASTQWGNNWRMPTSEELQALLDNCDVERIDGNTKKYKETTIKGYLFKGKAITIYGNNSIFLPEAGYSFYGMTWDCGHYWSSTKYDDSNHKYLYWYTNSQGQPIVFMSNGQNAWGNSVRAVLKDSSGASTEGLIIDD